MASSGDKEDDVDDEYDGDTGDEALVFVPIVQRQVSKLKLTPASGQKNTTHCKLVKKIKF